MFGDYRHLQSVVGILQINLPSIAYWCVCYASLYMYNDYMRLKFFVSINYLTFFRKYKFQVISHSPILSTCYLTNTELRSVFLFHYCFYSLSFTDTVYLFFLRF